MRLLLAQAPFRDTFGYSMPPPGLLRLGGELLRRGVDVELEDLALRRMQGRLAAGDLLIESAARLLLRRGDFDVIGLSVMGATLPAALAITRRLRELAPETTLLLGGPGLTGADSLVLERFPWIDAAVRGEAERTLPELLARLAAGRDLSGVAGVTWRDAEGAVRREADRDLIEDLGVLAPCAWELLPPLGEYKAVTGEREGLTPIDSGRGCAYDCSFCTIGRYWRRRSRPLPAERLADEVHALAHLEGARNAYLCHDLFGADREHALAFCDAMDRRGARPWEVRARVDHLDAELLRRMGRAGCYRVLLGVESGSPRVRALANKGQYAELDVLGVVEECARNGVRPILSLILGLPGEEEQDLEATLELVVRAALVSDALISLHLPNPQPGCGLHETHGADARPVEGIPPDMAFGCGETGPERELIAAHPDLFSTWALLGDPPERLRELAELAAHLPEVVMRYPRTWELLRRATGRGHHDQFRAWRASGAPFPEHARELAGGDALVADALAWETAAAGYDGALPADAPAPAAPAAAPDVLARARGRVVRLRHDLPALTGALARGEALPETDPVVLVVTPVPGGVRSDRVGEGLARLHDHLASPVAVADLERETGLAPTTLESLAASGLVELLPPDAPR